MATAPQHSGQTWKDSLIGGKWVDAAAGKTFPTINPATGETITDRSPRAMSATPPRGRGRPQSL